jgi:hypothetical protein
METVTDLLGPAAPTDDFLRSVVRDAVAGRAGDADPEVSLESVTAERVPYDSGSPATGALVRLRGMLADGTPWSVFVKLLQNPRHWVHINRMPPPARAQFIADFPWRSEVAAWEPDFAGRLPAGLRVPRLYRMAAAGGDHLALWMEDVDTDSAPWDLSRFALAARLLGAFAANRSDSALLSASPRPAGFGLLKYVEGEAGRAIEIIREPATWRHPALAGYASLQSGLIDLAGQIPALLELLAALPQSLPHGDASPQNLLASADEPGTLVAIDIAFQTPHAIGFDLAQLLVGLVHAGELPAAALPDIDRVLTPEFTRGLHQASPHPASASDVERGYVTTLALRSGFTSLPLRQLDTASPELVAQRCALTRFILDRTRRLHRSGQSARS